MRTTAATLILLCSASLASAQLTEARWSSRFATGVSYTVFEDGAICLKAFDSPMGRRLYIGGEFTAINGTECRSIAAYDGVGFIPIPSLHEQYHNERVADFAVYPINNVPRLVLAGFFNSPNANNGLGYLDQFDQLQGIGAGPFGNSAWFASATAWQSPNGPELIVGTSLTPPDSAYIYRHTPSGFLPMSPGVITITTANAVFDDGTGPKVYIGVPMDGGAFNDSLSVWNGTTLTAASPQPGMGWVQDLYVYDDGSGPALYVAGQGLKRFRNGAWQAVPGAPANAISTMCAFDDGSGMALYVAGQFTTVNGQPMPRITRWRNGVWEPLGTGFPSGTIKAMEVFDEDGPGPAPAGLYVVGTFTTVNGIASRGIARWGQEGSACPTCPADFDMNGGVDGADLGAFFANYEAGAACADVDLNGGIDGADLAAFFASYEAGGC